MRFATTGVLLRSLRSQFAILLPGGAKRGMASALNRKVYGPSASELNYIIKDEGGEVVAEIMPGKSPLSPGTPAIIELVRGDARQLDVHSKLLMRSYDVGSMSSNLVREMGLTPVPVGSESYEDLLKAETGLVSVPEAENIVTLPIAHGLGAVKMRTYPGKATNVAGDVSLHPILGLLLQTPDAANLTGFYRLSNIVPLAQMIFYADDMQREIYKQYLTSGYGATRVYGLFPMNDIARAQKLEINNVVLADVNGAVKQATAQHSSSLGRDFMEILLGLVKTLHSSGSLGAIALLRSSSYVRGIPEDVATSHLILNLANLIGAPVFGLPNIYGIPITIGAEVGNVIDPVTLTLSNYIKSKAEIAIAPTSRGR